jgi:hypothetical protein
MLTMHRENWTAEEFATLFAGTARECAARFGRTEEAVNNMRKEVLNGRRSGPVFDAREIERVRAESVTVCPVHFLALPATGVCDDC